MAAAATTQASAEPPAAASEPLQPPCPSGNDAIESPPTDMPVRPRKLRWAQLLRRTLGVDGLACPGCGATMVVLALISKPDTVVRILKHLSLPTAVPPIAAARMPDESYADPTDDWHANPPDDALDQFEVKTGPAGPRRSSRDPPIFRKAAA